MIHFLGGEERVLQKVSISRGDIPLGSQRLALLAPDTAVRITAFTEDLPGHERQLRSLLDHTPLVRFQWVNIAHHCIDFITLTK